MNGLTDQQLLRDYAEHRAEAAFAELARRHVDLVYSAALRMVRDAQLAEDVTQAVFVALAQNAQHLTNRPILSGWLHRTAQNLAAKAVRTDVRRRTREQEAAAMNELLADSGTGVSPVWSEIAPHLDAALGELSEPDRDAVLLRYFEKKSAAEMAQVLGISHEAAQKRVSRAVDRLREFFAKRGIAVGAGGLVVVISANAVHAAPVGLAVTISAAVLAELGKIALVTTGTAAASTATATVLGLNAKLAVAAVVAAVGVGGYVAFRAMRPAETAPTAANARLVAAPTSPLATTATLAAAQAPGVATAPLLAAAPAPTTETTATVPDAPTAPTMARSSVAPDPTAILSIDPAPMVPMLTQSPMTRATVDGTLTLFAARLMGSNPARLDECFAGTAEAEAFRRLWENPANDAERQFQQVLKSIGVPIEVVQTTATEDGLKVKWKAAVQRPFTTTEDGASKAWQRGDRYELELQLKEVGGEWKIVGF